MSRITDKVIGEVTEWCNRPLEAMYPVVFIDAVHVTIRDVQVTNRPIYVAVGVTSAGERDILGLWVGDGGEGSSGRRCSPRSRTAAPPTCASWSATASKDCPRQDSSH